MPRTIPVKMAKASDEDRFAVKEMLRLLESVSVWGEFDPDPDDDSVEPVAMGAAELGERLLGMMADQPCALSRVVWGFEVLVDSACDPNQNQLDWKPEIRANLERLTALEGAIERSGYDLSPCMTCGEPTVCLPDGLPSCEPCSKQEQNTWKGP